MTTMPTINICMTSFPRRITNCVPVINSVLENTLVPDRIYLTLSHQEFPNWERDLPIELYKLVMTSDRVILNWVEPNDNTNSTTFTALPAGLYNPALHRFEGLRSTTGFWAMGMSPEGTASAVLVPYYCDSPIIDPQLDAKALSVRCVRDNVSQ